MRHLGWLLLVLLVVVLARPDRANALRRAALIIGNGAYTKVPALTNPTRDAEAVEKLLRDSGFDFVRRADNLGVIAMRRALRDFSIEVSSADIALVFFAGHGIEVNGTNYLIPIDAVLERDLDVEDEALPLERVNQILESARRLRLIILDACRDNPFVRSMKRSVSSRSIGRGLAKVEVLTTDTLIAYAAKAGSTASDGSARNSPYTLALLNHLMTPGLDVRLALGRVRDEVLKTTNNQQEPFVYGSLGGAEIVLVTATIAETKPHLETGTTVYADAFFTEDRVQQVRTLAQQHGFRLPEFRIELPAANVPLDARRFLGVWLDEIGTNPWRRLMIIVTRAASDGKVEGWYLYGPSTAASISQNAAGLFKIDGSVSNGSLTFKSPGGTERLTLSVMSDGGLSYLFVNEKGQTNQRGFRPVWTLMEAERSSK